MRYWYELLDIPAKHRNMPNTDVIALWAENTDSAELLPYLLPTVGTPVAGAANARDNGSVPGNEIQF